MDVVLHYADEFALDHVYNYLLPHPPIPTSETLGLLNTTSSPSSPYTSFSTPPLTGSLLPRDSLLRQYISLLAIAVLGAYALYFSFCSLSYFFVYDRRLEHHPKFLKNQIRKEIKSSLIAAPYIGIITVPWFMGEIHGYSKMYENVGDYGWTYLVGSMVWFLLFTDFCIYWVHRLEHHPRIYKYIHKPHHKWVVPTPYAALAFHPLDGYAQSLPYHIFPYLFPLHRYAYLGLFVFVQFWTILIHDGDMISGHVLERWINGPAHHTLHHLYFSVNYGQYFTWADVQFDSFREPRPELDPIHESLRMMRKKGLIDEHDKPIPQIQNKKNE
ncbi:hypothetical protein I350_07036 [Cryptococcus amylolentus CBS 6273]|uniref:Fatty acid hydroxylase domain-containing protein n=1 Tax=Cryptococcus amylolentus CBS 6273 TaxID=1296118 RepID=A0A1E3JHT0_9TREE|nr:hypothetical protein I350_07036 [Cryptococcus amylolentus CBS 6273]